MIITIITILTIRIINAIYHMDVDKTTGKQTIYTHKERICLGANIPLRTNFINSSLQLQS